LKYAALVKDERLRKGLDNREEEISRWKEDLMWDQQVEDDCQLYELRKSQHKQEREWWKRKLRGELWVVEKKSEMEKKTLFPAPQNYQN